MKIRLKRLALVSFSGLIGYFCIQYFLFNNNGNQQKSGLSKKHEPFFPEEDDVPINKQHEGEGDQPTTISEDDWMAKMLQKQEVRRTRLRKVCSSLYNRSVKDPDYLSTHKTKLRSLIVNDKFQFIYSIVYKVGSTNWERVIVQDLEGFQNIPNQKLYSHKALTWMPKFSEESIKERLRKYTKFVFVRNPLSRILSGYRDKFVDHHNSVFSSLARRIVKQYRKDAAANYTGTNVTFAEFVSYLVDSAENRANPHWKPVYVQNLPCEVEYDIIGKLEEAGDDIPYVLKRIGIWNMTEYGKGPPRKNRDAELLQQYYSQIPPRLLQELYKVYEPDFHMFGYAMPLFF